MRLWKRGPAHVRCAGVHHAIGQHRLRARARYSGFVASNVIAPLLATGMLYASLAADRGEGPRIRAPDRTLCVAGPRTSGGRRRRVWSRLPRRRSRRGSLPTSISSLPSRDAANLPMRAVVAIYAAGIVASLPLTFVPFAALFDGEGFRAAFATSARAFARNVPALIALRRRSRSCCCWSDWPRWASGLVLVLPWIAAASYAGWKDIFGL